MQIPTIKTLITYIKTDEVKKVLCNIELGDDKYAQIDYEHDIISRCPFDEIMYPDEIHKIYDGAYEITHYEDDMSMYKVDVIVNHVLEFNGKIFLLQETNYDMKEFEDDDYWQTQK